jgi:hypothetical protein
MRNFGKHGVVADTVGEALPIGVWSDARNIRFSGVEMEKMYEPTEVVELPDGEVGLHLQGFSDGRSSYLCAASEGKLWFLRSDYPGHAEWVLAGSGYRTDGQWQSFSWGTTCIFNNGRDKPQIFDNGQLQFVDLPNWGVISTAEDLTFNEEPSKDTNARCKVLLPYKNFLVALGITESGRFQPNTVWWSDATALAGLDDSLDGGGPPSWDYESPATLSAKSEVGAGSGHLNWGAELNEQLILYTDNSATAMMLVGGPLVMDFRRMFNKGCAGLYLAAEYNNQHFVVSGDQLYVHDGSTVQLIARDRVEDEFFRRAGKRGRLV